MNNLLSIYDQNTSCNISTNEFSSTLLNNSNSHSFEHNSSDLMSHNSFNYQTPKKNKLNSKTINNSKTKKHLGKYFFKKEDLYFEK